MYTTQYLIQLSCFTIGPIRKPPPHGFQSTVPTASNSSTLKTTSLMSKAKLGSTARPVSTATVGSTATLEFTAKLGSRKVHAYLSVVLLLIYTKHLTRSLPSPYYRMHFSSTHTVKLGTSCTRLWEALMPPPFSQGVFRYFKDSFSAAFH